jgi:ribosome-associated protein
MTKQKPWHVEQDNKADWILMDYSDIILHIFQEETRSFYNLKNYGAMLKKPLTIKKLNEREKI